MKFVHMLVKEKESGVFKKRRVYEGKKRLRRRERQCRAYDSSSVGRQVGRQIGTEKDLRLIEKELEATGE